MLLGHVQLLRDVDLLGGKVVVDEAHEGVCAGGDVGRQRTGRSGPRRRSGPRTGSPAAPEPRPDPLELPRVPVERRLEVVDRPALGEGEAAQRQPESSVWFSTSIVNMPAVGDVSPLYVQPSLVSRGAHCGLVAAEAMGTRDTAAVSSATAMRALDAHEASYRRG